MPVSVGVTVGVFDDGVSDGVGVEVSLGCGVLEGVGVLLDCVSDGVGVKVGVGGAE